MATIAAIAMDLVLTTFGVVVIAFSFCVPVKRRGAQRAAHGLSSSKGAQPGRRRGKATPAGPMHTSRK
jgi:hypothetical protein